MLLLGPLKGNSPTIIMKRITPIAQTSIAGVIYLVFPFKTSGAIYLKLPASMFSTFYLEATPAIPKSTTFLLEWKFNQFQKKKKL